MAPIIPDPKKMKSFRNEATFTAWMKAHHARETELWLKIYKKGSGLPTVTAAQALDVAFDIGVHTVSVRPEYAGRATGRSPRVGLAVTLPAA
jgi:uncharacterized protein YdeI (YjbR/CyaY-like superfamily)